MAFESNFISFVGNLVEDPELRFTQSGIPVCSFRIACNQKRGDNEETVFMNGVTWRDLAENVAESLRKGQRVVVLGRVKVRSYENQQGQTVWVTEIEADEVGPSLRWARAEVARPGGSSPDSPPVAPPSDDDVPF